MFGFIKQNKKNEASSTQSNQETKQNWFARLRFGLQRTRANFADKLSQLVLGKKTIDEGLLEELETILIAADVGVATSQKILNTTTQQMQRKSLNDPQALIPALKQQLMDILAPCEVNEEHARELEINAQPFTILFVGINGAGKTTSIAKLAKQYQDRGKKVLLAAGDTFRAAAIDQLQVWGDRNQVPVIAQHSGANSASVIFDALTAAKARQFDVVLADTAGRLHTQAHLMTELAKIKRVMKKIDEHAPHETLLILDAGIGQNALQQAEQFHNAIGINSIAITKLDGTAKGGIIFAIADKMKLPIRFIGVGEQLDDLKPFNAKEFVEALFS